MKTLINELIELTEQTSKLTNLPSVEQVILPPAVSATEHKYSKFGLMLLSDGSAGFFYRLLDQAEWQERYSDEQIDSALHNSKGVNPATLASGLRSQDPLARGLGMAAINAVSQHVFNKAGYTPESIQREPSKGSETTGRIGMVGYFGPMVSAFQKACIDTTVIELDESLYQETSSLLVTGDLSQLEHCDLVYCTASTLLNNSLEAILQRLPHKPQFELIGPTCGCFADPFFKRGVSKIGGSSVVDTDQAVANIRALKPWGNSVRKYEISADTYPGFDFLARKLRQKNQP